MRRVTREPRELQIDQAERNLRRADCPEPATSARRCRRSYAPANHKFAVYPRSRWPRVAAAWRRSCRTSQLQNDRMILAIDDAIPESDPQNLTERKVGENR